MTGNLLEMQTLPPQPRPTESENRGGGGGGGDVTQKSVTASTAGNSDAWYCLRNFDSMDIIPQSSSPIPLCYNLTFSMKAFF